MTQFLVKKKRHQTYLNFSLKFFGNMSQEVVEPLHFFL